MRTALYPIDFQTLISASDGMAQLPAPRNSIV